MSQIKLLHSGGNGVSIVAPDSNPASDRTLKLPSDGDGTILTTNSATGKILQVVEMKKTDTTSINPSTSWADVSGLAITITPTSASNKILLTGMINHSHVGQHIGSRIVRSVGGSDAIPTGWVADASGSRTQTLTGNWGFSAEANDGNEMLNISIIDDLSLIHISEPTRPY